MTTATKETERAWPKVGDTVWIRLKDDVRGYPVLAAVVFDHYPNPSSRAEPDRIDPPFEGTLNLAIKVDRKKFSSSGTTLYRLNVEGPYEGDGGIEPTPVLDRHGAVIRVDPPPGCGMWMFEKPEWADEQTEAALQKRKLDKHYWRLNHRTPNTGGRRNRDRTMRPPE